MRMNNNGVYARCLQKVDSKEEAVWGEYYDKDDAKNKKCRLPPCGAVQKNGLGFLKRFGIVRGK